MNRSDLRGRAAASSTIAFEDRWERRESARSVVRVPIEVRPQRSFPRDEDGDGFVEEISERGARIRTGRPLTAGQWLRIEMRPSLRERNQMPESVRLATGFTARVVRRIGEDLHEAAPHIHAVEFARSARARLLAAVDRALPWLGLASITAVAATAVWLKGDSLYYFWYHPIIHLYGILLAGFILSRVALAAGYRPPGDAGYFPAVTVAVACKNEEASIRTTLDRIFRSDYPEDLLEVIAVDDGSTDGTWSEMELAQRDHPSLRLIRFESNRGKRNAIGAAARDATGEILVCVDSDSFVERRAVRRIVQGFADPSVGAVCGNGRVENSGVNVLTKMQEVRYYIAFRILKAAESRFSAVTCCSGCFAAYRRSALLECLDAWLGQRFLGVPATFGDDRGLTAFMLRRFRVIFDSRAVCSTLVPSDLRTYLRQQLRWKKSWIRESVLASSFMWKRHPAAAASFYLGLVFGLVSPAVVCGALFLPLAGIGTFAPVYLYGTLLMALLYGLIYYVRHKNALWIHGLLWSALSVVLLAPQTYYALATLRRNHWGTR